MSEKKESTNGSLAISCPLFSDEEGWEIDDHLDSIVSMTDGRKNLSYHVSRYVEVAPVKRAKLSDRVRPNSEAAPWVCDEILKMEARIAELEAAGMAVVASLDSAGQYPDTAQEIASVCAAVKQLGEAING